MKGLIAGAPVVLVMTLQADPLPDPTRPADYVPEPVVTRQAPEYSMNWTVSAIRISADESTAIVNGRLVREGERIGEATIVAISPGAVMLEYRREEIEINLVPDNVKIVRGD